jgi:hypothetical protein
MTLALSGDSTPAQPSHHSRDLRELHLKAPTAATATPSPTPIPEEETLKLTPIGAVKRGDCLPVLGLLGIVNKAMTNSGRDQHSHKSRNLLLLSAW